MDWTVTPHALGQMEERGIARDQLDTLLARPRMTLPDPKGQPGCRVYSGDGMVAIVNEDVRTVITVGYHGASREDWETFKPPTSGTSPAEPVRFRKRRKRVKDKGLPVTTRSVLDDLHPSIAAGVREVMAQHGLVGFRAVRIISPTEVEIVLPKGK